MTSPVRVVVADDHAHFREGLLALLATIAEVEVVGEAQDGEEAVRIATSAKADVVLMDLRMPRLDGVDATRRLRAESPKTRVVVLTTFDDDDSIFDAVRAGALGYLLKDASRQTLSAAITEASQGRSIINPKVATRLVKQVAATQRERGAGSARLDVLTPRERQVLGLIGRGATNKDIARHLDLAEGTVKNHVTAVFAKLNVTDRLQAALLARDYGEDD